MSATPDLLHPEALRRLFAHLEEADGVLAAVSGGPDSVALMHMLAAWSRNGGRPPVLAATVDHSLRPEGADEARQVSRAASGLGLSHETLAWTGPKPAAGLQEAARAARYGLLTACAQSHGASHIVTAHTLDDQAETVLMRLARGSGLAGLAGMRRVVLREGVRHVRPLLDLRKADLVALCRARGWAFVEDPSNRDERFARARWRTILPLLEEEGLTAERLARLAARVQRAEEALDLKAREALEGAGLATGPGAARFDGAVLVREPFEIAVRALALAVQGCRRGGGHLRLERLEDCAARLRQALNEGTALRTTLAGTVIRLDTGGQVAIALETQRRRGRYRSIRDDAAAAPHSLGNGGVDA